MATTLDALPIHARQLATESLTWSDRFWSPNTSLLALGPEDDPAPRHNVRNSAWYALGLLLRNDSGDQERARRTLEAVLDNQMDRPGTPYHGTFFRYLGEPEPPLAAQMWQDYDPNWRQFIGTTLALILDEYGQLLPAHMVQRMDRAIQLAVVGEPPQRCSPAYTNIALMKSALLTWAGDRFGREDWVREGETFGRAVFDLFARYRTYNEYNSPTYYGVNFYALALWRRHSRSETLARLGAEMEADLWRDVAQFYHAGLGNLCGPYTRSYGMDMGCYGALLGMSIWLLVGRDLAPFPRARGYFEHGHDFCFGPPLALLDTRAPAAALSHLQTFVGERRLERRLPLEPERTVTAWLGHHAMIGAESIPLEVEVPARLLMAGAQYHPATLHWRAPGEDLGWMRLRHLGPVDARAAAGTLAVTGGIQREVSPQHADAHRRYTFEFYAPGGVAPGALDGARWQLPGLDIAVESDVADRVLDQDGPVSRVHYTLAPDQRAAHFHFTLT